MPAIRRPSRPRSPCRPPAGDRNRFLSRVFVARARAHGRDALGPRLAAPALLLVEPTKHGPVSAASSAAFPTDSRSFASSFSKEACPGRLVCSRPSRSTGRRGAVISPTTILRDWTGNASDPTSRPRGCLRSRRRIYVEPGPSRGSEKSSRGPGSRRKGTSLVSLPISSI